MSIAPTVRGGLWAWVLVACAAACGDCGGAQVSRCTDDRQCQSVEGLYRVCLVETGLCGCVDERGCEEGEVCNALGRCQARVGCLSNDDCAQDPEGSFCGSQYCDTSTGQCKGNCDCDPDEGERCCTLDSHCGFGQVCNVFENRCIPGCRSDGDCFLGQGCVGAGLGGQLGQCDTRCTANNLCQYGESCNLETGDCVFDTRGPYCFGCTGGVASDDCGEPGNYCLTDTSDPSGQTSFCGVDCSRSQPCPFGFDCNEVIIIPPAAPFCSAERCLLTGGAGEGRCEGSSTVTCTRDEDCPYGLPGGDCPRALVGNCLNDQQQPCERDVECCDDPASCPEGSCVKQECRGGEGDAFGYCSCTRDSDCPADACEGADLSDPQNPLRGNCELSGHPCFEDLDCDVIACVGGGCRIGANCAPANDRNCRELVQGVNVP